MPQLLAQGLVCWQGNAEGANKPQAEQLKPPSLPSSLLSCLFITASYMDAFL